MYMSVSCTEFCFVSTIFLMDFRTFLTEWYFLFFTELLVNTRLCKAEMFIPMLPVSLDCPFVIVPSVCLNVYSNSFLIKKENTRYFTMFSLIFQYYVIPDAATWANLIAWFISP